MKRRILAPALLLPAAMSATLLLPAADPSVLPESLREHAALTKAESIDSRVEAIETLAASGDPKVLPWLIDAMDGERPGDDPNELQRARAAATIGIAQNFPERAAELFERLLREGTPNQRESAGYGLGYLDGEGALELAMSMLESADPAIRQAASTAVLKRGRDASLAAQLAVYHLPNSRPPLTPEQLAERDEVLDTVTRRIEKETPPPDSPLFRIVHQLGDSRTAATLVRAYCDRIDETSPELAALLRKLYRVNDRWLGRPVPPSVAEVDYQLEMDNLIDEAKPYTQQVTFGPDEFEVLYFRDTRPDRGTRAIFPLDTLLTYPQALSPRISRTGDGRASLEYLVPRYTGVDASIGIPMVIEAWRGSVGAQRGTVEIDTEQGVPLIDKMYDADGKLVAQVKFADYVEISAGKRVPRFIEIRARDSRRGWLRYDLHYQVVEPGVWILSHAEAYQGTPDGEARRAIVKVNQLRITPHPPADAG